LAVTFPNAQNHETNHSLNSPPARIAATRKAIKAEPWNAEGWNKDILAIEELIKEIEADKNSAPVLSIEEFTGKKGQP